MANTVTITQPQNPQVGTVGVANSLSFVSTDSATGQTLTWTSSNLPAGMSISSATGIITGTPTTVQAVTTSVTATDTTGAAGTITFSWTISANSGNAGWPDIAFGLPTTDGNGVVSWPVTTWINGGPSYGGVTASNIRVLTPSSPSSAYPHNILVTMPESGGIDHTATTGNGFDTIQGLGSQNAYNFTLVEASFQTDPFYGDNPLDTATRLETYLLEVIAWAKTTYAVTGSELVYVIGFSKSGHGAQTMQFKHPDVIHASAAWDSMFELQDTEGTDPAGEDAGAGSSAYSVGTDANFTANYELSSANLTRWMSGKNFTTTKRIWVGGYDEFAGDVTGYKSLLTSLGIQYDGFWNYGGDSHAWHAGWVSSAIASMFSYPPYAPATPPAPAFGRIGTAVVVDSTSISFVTAATGNTVFLIVVCAGTTSTITAVTGGNCTGWTQVGGSYTATSASGTVVAFAGTVAATGSATISLTTSAGTVRGSAMELSTPANWALDTISFLDNSAGAALMPAVTPSAAGEMYVGFEYDGSACVPGGTPGYVYSVDTHGNALVYSTSCNASAQSPGFGSPTATLGGAYLLKNTAVVASPVSGTVFPPGTPFPAGPSWTAQNGSNQSTVLGDPCLASFAIDTPPGRGVGEQGSSYFGGDHG